MSHISENTRWLYHNSLPAVFAKIADKLGVAMDEITTITNEEQQLASDQAGMDAVITAVGADAAAALKQIQDLKAQVAAGTPVTAAQLAAIEAPLQGMHAKIQTQTAALQAADAALTGGGGAPAAPVGSATPGA